MLKSLIRKNKMKFIFAWKRNKKTNFEAYMRELNFLKKYLSNDEMNYLHANSMKKNLKSYSSYLAMAQSKVTVGVWSTMLREQLATGRKVLSCNLLRVNFFNFPIGGICTIKNCTYTKFEKRLMNIYKMSDKKYFSKLGRDKCYMVNYEKNNSTINIIKRKIDFFLSKNK